jgi:hypothetical protein
MASHLAVGSELGFTGTWYRRQRICAAPSHAFASAGFRSVGLDPFHRQRGRRSDDGTLWLPGHPMRACPQWPSMSLARWPRDAAAPASGSWSRRPEAGPTMGWVWTVEQREGLRHGCMAAPRRGDMETESE